MVSRTKPQAAAIPRLERISGATVRQTSFSQDNSLGTRPKYDLSTGVLIPSGKKACKNE
jgi:hypothetical protein